VSSRSCQADLSITTLSNKLTVTFRNFATVLKTFCPLWRSLMHKYRAWRIPSSVFRSRTLTADPLSSSHHIFLVTFLKMLFSKFAFFSQYRSVFCHWFANPFECILRNPKWVNALKIHGNKRPEREESKKLHKTSASKEPQRIVIVKAINLSKLILRSSYLKVQRSFIRGVKAVNATIGQN
jgi:hypothetical protein